MASTGRDSRCESPRVRTPAKRPSVVANDAAPGSGTDGESMIITHNLRKILEAERLKNGGVSPRAPKKASAGRGSGVRPNFLLCYLCGNMFGTQSLAIHQQQCYLKKMIEWERTDVVKRGPRPESPRTHERLLKESGRAFSPSDLSGRGGKGGGATAARNMERFNEAQQQYYNENILRPCPNCSRTFRPEALEIHLRSCKPGNAAKPVTRRPNSAAATTPPSGPTATPQPSSSTGAKQRPSVASPNATTTPPSAVSFDDQPIRPKSSVYQLPEGDLESAAPPFANGGAAASGTRKQHHTDPSASLPLVGRTEEADAVAPTAPAGAKSPLGNPGNADNHGESIEKPKSPLSSDMEVEEGVVADICVPSPTRATGSPVSGAPPCRRSSVNTSSSESEANLSSTAAPVPVVRLSEAAISPGATVSSASESPSRHQGDPAAATAVATKPQATPRSSPSGTNGAGRVSSGPATDANASSGALDEQTGTPRRRTIQLNNVSKFQNVPSRIKQEMAQKNAKELPRCQFCNRTFLDTRLEKHESVCLERLVPKPVGSKAAGKGHRNSMSDEFESPTTGRGGAGPSGQTQRKSIGPGSRQQPTKASVPSGNAGSSAQARFCFNCGTKLQAEAVKFCSSCGTKIAE